jgi:iron complex outermembrane recepter protein
LVRSTNRWRTSVVSKALFFTAAVLPGVSGAGEPREPETAAAAPDAATRDDDRPPFGEEIVVTATRSPRPRRDVPAAVTVLLRSEIERSPTKTVDELLRVVPSFGLFRRTSSMVSDPTAQGVNLRGIGPSGVSRSLVLVDGIPENDPFGGWVYWRGIPRMDIERIEVTPGGGSALYGNYALGGVTEVFSRPITPATADVSSEYGSFNSYLLGGRASDRWGNVGAAVEGELLKSGGYAVVAPAGRGLIDGDAPSQHAAVHARVEAAATPELALTLRGGWFRETENGGTQFTTAAVRRFGYSGSARYTPGESGVFDLSVFGHAPQFDQDRARISQTTPPRKTAFLGESQTVPAHDVGAGLRWTSPPLELAGAHTLTLGSDVRRITGSLNDDFFPATITGTTRVGLDVRGEQRIYGVFGQEVYDVTSALAVSLALRYDHWNNVDASQVVRFGNGSTEPTDFRDRGDSQVSPKVGLRLRPMEWLTLRASAYRAFRAPTLNELYRPFQVGLIVTQPNPNLGPEKLRGAEAGFELAPLRALTTRVTGFWNELDDPIVNVTTGTNLQERRNLGRARIRGIEADAGWRLGRAWRAIVAYTFVDSRVTAAPDPAQVGKELLQDPRHRASFSLTFDEPRLLSAGVQVRYIGRQFDDDLNTRPLPAAVLVDLSASRRVTRNLDVVLAVENLLDEEYLVGRAGVDTVGQPRFIHGGVRVHFGE